MNSAPELLKYRGKSISLDKFRSLVKQLDTENKLHFERQLKSSETTGSVKLSFSKETVKKLKIASLTDEKIGAMTLEEVAGLYGIEVHEADLSGASKKSFFAEVSRRIIKLIKGGELPWRMPWNKNFKDKELPENIIFANYITNKNYRGINRSMCGMFGGGDVYFVTANQAKERGGTIKKGAEGVPICYIVKTEKDVTKEIKKPDGTKETVIDKELIVGLKNYLVYPISQVEGMAPIKRRSAKPEGSEKPFEPIEVAEKIIQSYKGGPPIRYRGNQAYYMPAYDTVTMPPKAAFNSVPEFYCTLFHELAHSTGHPDRLDRKQGNKFGSKDYAAEELVAELTASFLCSVCKIDYFTLNNSAAYLKNWSQKLIYEFSKDNTLFVKTQFAALKAAKMMMGAYYKVWERSLEPEKKQEKKIEEKKVVEVAKTKPEATKKPAKKKSNAVKFNPETPTDLLALFLKGKRIKTASWDRWADKNTRVGSRQLTMNWLSPEGDPLDSLAKYYQMEFGFEGPNDEKEIIQQIIDFITAHPGGVNSYIKKRIAEQQNKPETLQPIKVKTSTRKRKESTPFDDDYFDPFDNFPKPHNRNFLNGYTFTGDEENIVFTLKALPTKLAKRLNIGNGNVELKEGNLKFGLNHILKNHPDLFETENDAILFVFNTIINFDQIRKAKGKDKYFLIQTNNRNATVVELRIEKNNLSVVTAYNPSKDQIKKMPLLWTRPEPLGSPRSPLKKPTFTANAAKKGDDRRAVGGSTIGISNLQESRQKSKKGLSGVMSSADLAAMKYDTLKLTGIWAKWLGAPASNFDMMVDGQPGGGKTTLLLQFAEYMAKNQGRKTLFVSKEEFGAATLSDKIKRLDIKNVFFTNTLNPDSNLQADGYQVVFVDSITALKFKPEDYLKLRELNPDIAFILILQRTKDGNFKGGNDWPHEVEIVPKVEDGHSYTEKNRYTSNSQPIKIPNYK